MALLGGNSTRSIDLMQRSMSAAVMRNHVINNNLSNASTPNYKRRDVTFQAELERAIDSEKEAQIPFKMSRRKHINHFKAKDYKEVKAKVITEYNTYQNNNGNSVDVDKEMLEGAKNTMYFNAMAQRTAKEFNKIKLLLR